MAIDFPNSPTTGDTYTAGGRTWQWDGTVWAAYGNYPDPTVLKIDTGTNRVGINNTSPTTALDVTGDLTVSGNISGGSITGAGMTVSSTAPSSPSEGEMWYNEVSGRTFVYYDDGSSQQWVEFGVPPNGSKIALASYADSAARTTALPSPSEADLSYLQDTNSVEVYDGSAWAAVGAAGGKILQVVRATDTSLRSTTSATFVDITGASVTITPTSATSNIIVVFSGEAVSDTTGTMAMEIQITDSSNNALSGAEGIFFGNNSSDYSYNNAIVIGYASPASTSAQTYKARFHTAGATARIRGDENTTQMYAFEVGA
jgi:hypothetical protein